ncbi:DUF2232 domain-containing protein [Leptolyngbya sp. FACHB-261]|uniref:DUF2232 domain-containing protein n=1 Tax=Leptolyngbya sp. FACHB-261 TaxID=2692806 RepID=UPI0016822D12|nr:DUF2232 domain-containing protein [Leptolyngbya sp. FACHB-261]MBD2101254.1 DUF2232 domain-containing protein [Leptolyngbya sp. FACHB-261]
MPDSSDPHSLDDLPTLPATAEEMADLDAAFDFDSQPKEETTAQPDQRNSTQLTPPPLVLVETAFLASTSGMLWLVNYYFPMGPLLRTFFPVPIALAFLRWGSRASVMTTVVTGLLLSVLMGPDRSIRFVIPYGLLGVLLGLLWKRRASWWLSMGLGSVVAAFGLFFNIALLSVLLGEDLWLYLTTQISGLVDWLFFRLGILAQPSLQAIQVVAALMVVINAVLYLFLVHLVSWLMLERLGNPIPDPPDWLRYLLAYEEDTP